MQLVIDIGNTLIKSYVFEEDQQIDFAAEPITEWKSSLKDVKRHAQIKMAMVMVMMN